ncbi:hypothetical protein PIB30_039655 [Stylosanthes scabra]|uniref:Uncharacterized protein n=1 Tax=Stylosanthes scabra TaxID=79078 RepID=A0ABU6UEU9_9FABA|nr:hypothetical protein [Stylosanthes scabra]
MKASSPPPRSRSPTFEEMMERPKVSFVRAVPGKPIMEPKYPPSSEPPSPEPSDAQRQEYLESRCPLYLLAMQCYNQKRKEGEEQYKVISPVGVGQITCYGDCGDLPMIFWRAQPKSIENVDKSAFKYFCATVHEISPVQFHVPFSDIFPGDPYKLDRNGRPPLPICCQICGLMNHHAFKQRAKELKDQREKERLDSRSNNNCNSDILVIPIKAIAQGPLGNRVEPMLGGGQKEVNEQVEEQRGKYAELERRYHQEQEEWRRSYEIQQGEIRRLQECINAQNNEMWDLKTCMSRMHAFMQSMQSGSSNSVQLPLPPPPPPPPHFDKEGPSNCKRDDVDPR